ncbi:MAG: acetolactate decarboxylase [Synergistaceae bacterium]|nr:acetolactate decarboxylase [Synergistaceae bacterium]
MEKNTKMFQISTLQALALGYSRAVINVAELLLHGNIGLGTFEDVNGEMIVIDGHCYRANEKGEVNEADGKTGVPFASVTDFAAFRSCELGNVDSIEKLKEFLDLRIEEDFGLNSMHIVRINGSFKRVSARSESGYRAHHVTLKDALKETQRSFYFDDISGTLVCVYYPDYMDGINASGWHLHFISEDRKEGGHVFDLSMENGTAYFDKITNVEIMLPHEPAFDTYALKGASKDEIKSVEQGK